MNKNKIKYLLIIIGLFSCKLILAQELEYIDIKKNNIKQIQIERFQKEDKYEKFVSSSIVVYEFDKEGKTIKELIISNLDTIRCIYYKYDSVLNKEVIAYEKNQIIQHEKYDYRGNLIEVFSYSLKNELIFNKKFTYKYIYKTDKIIEEIGFDSDTNLILNKKYFYTENGLITNINEYDKNDSLKKKIDYQYKLDLILTERVFDRKGEIVKYTHYLYNSNYYIQEKKERIKPVKTRKVKYGHKEMQITIPTLYKKHLFKYKGSLLSEVSLYIRERSKTPEYTNSIEYFNKFSYSYKYYK